MRDIASVGDSDVDVQVSGQVTSCPAAASGQDRRNLLESLLGRHRLGAGGMRPGFGHPVQFEILPAVAGGIAGARTNKRADALVDDAHPQRHPLGGQPVVW